MTSTKLLKTESELREWCNRIRLNGKLVVTNGCFDIIHPAHIDYLRRAAAFGSHLLVGLNGDDSVRRLKGEGRPINSVVNRAIVLEALEMVSAVYIFEEPRATRFLRMVGQAAWVKGGDYAEESLDPEEVQVVNKNGGDIHIVPLVPGYSTSAIIEKILQMASNATAT
jgi:rfaE bifunctional protein nucleotidyltransferase chain/domain